MGFVLVCDGHPYQRANGPFGDNGQPATVACPRVWSACGYSGVVAVRLDVADVGGRDVSALRVALATVDRVD